MTTGPLTLALVLAAVSSSKVRWVGEECERSVREELVRLVGIEMQSTTGVRRVLISVASCHDGPVELSVLVDRGEHRDHERLFIELEDIELSARARVAALFIGEALRAREKVAFLEPRTIHSPLVMTSSIGAADRAGAGTVPVTVDLRVNSTSLGSVNNLAWGLGLGMTFAPWSHLRFGLQGGWQSSSSDVDIGTVTIDLASIQLSAMFLTDLGVLTLAVGGALDVGLAFGAGSSRRQLVVTESQRGTFVVASGRLEVEVPVVRNFGILLGATAGPALRSFEARADSASVLGVKGVIGSAWMGLRLRFDSRGD